MRSGTMGLVDEEMTDAEERAFWDSYDDDVAEARKEQEQWVKKNGMAK